MTRKTSAIAAMLVASVLVVDQGSAQRPPRVETVAVPTDAVLQAVSPVSQSVVWISGHRGVVLRSTDSGRSWDLLPTPAGDSLQYRDIHAFDDQRAVILSAGTGTDSRILWTDDGGGTWTTGFLMDHPEGFMDCLDIWDNRGFAYGDEVDGVPYILRTEDGGKTWDRVAPEHLPEGRDGEGGFAASGTCALVGNDGTGWVGTGASGWARVLRTNDYGVSWQATDVPLETGPTAGTFSLARSESSSERQASDGEVLVALGGNLDSDSVVAKGAAVSFDGGVTFEPRLSPPIPGATYGGAAVGDVLTAVSPQGGRISFDLGQSWEPLNGVAAWAIAFAPETGIGWAAGTQGRVWRITLPEFTPFR